MSRLNDMTLGNRIKFKTEEIWEKIDRRETHSFEQLDQSVASICFWFLMDRLAVQVEEQNSIAMLTGGYWLVVGSVLALLLLRVKGTI